VTIHKLDSTNAFIAFDLDEVPGAVGIVRRARKILQDGAKLLARSTTYSFAAFEMQRGGASAGISADDDTRDEAVAAFATEVGELASAGRLSLDAGKGVDPAELAALADDRSEIRNATNDGVTLADEVRGLGALAASVVAFGDLDGRSIAVEGFDAAGVALARQAVRHGAKIVAVATPAGAVHRPEGFEADQLAQALSEHGAGMVKQLDVEILPAWQILGADVDLLFAGSKTGVVTHESSLSADLEGVVPIGPVPYTTKALATLGRAGVTVLPDFVAAGGMVHAWYPADGASVDEVRTAAIEAVADRTKEIMAAEDPPVLAACRMAEAYLATWRDALPFGRPMA
jgi:glutamate dehydrogenase/leucine dehydrogenase